MDVCTYKYGVQMYGRWKINRICNISYIEQFIICSNTRGNLKLIEWQFIEYDMISGQYDDKIAAFQISLTYFISAFQCSVFYHFERFFSYLKSFFVLFFFVRIKPIMQANN